MDTDVEKKSFVLKGIGVSPGIVIGKAFLYDRFDAQVSFYRLRDKSLVNREIKRFRAALKESEKQLLEVRNKLYELAGREPLYIIDVHIMILKDKMFINHTVQYIKDGLVNAEWAMKMTIDRYKEIFEKVEDEYLKDRVSDIHYVGQRILRNLSGRRQEGVPRIGGKDIIIAVDLSPADTAQMMINKVQGFATDMGGKTSHTAIVARAVEIPAVVGLESITKLVRTNDDIIIDGAAGLVVVNPDPEMIKVYEDKQRHFQQSQEDYLRYARLPALTADDYKVEIGGNIEFIEEIPSAVSHGAEGIGLYRTEFIYINKEKLPTEEEHFSHYKSVVSADGLQWATIRTF
ncbi:MAG: phosphoenolpyruvate--protein phosphotransferase, partial [Syntrophaceae bacterium]|nr:phosphoenolpyruvate--protein phosphotransferase [Syntrophaceae bacterium]